MKLKDLMYYIDETAIVKVITSLNGVSFYSKHSCKYWKGQFEVGSDPIFADREVRRIFPDETSSAICVEITAVI